MATSPHFPKRTTVVAVDVGIVHLAVVQATVAPDGRLEALPLVRLVDLTRLPHRRVPRCECALHHSNELADRLDHFYQEYGHVFDAADLVLVERQPITGLQAVQQSLFRQYRDRVLLVAPAAMHRHFGLCSHYEGRKRETVAIMRAVFAGIPHDDSELEGMDGAYLVNCTVASSARDTMVKSKGETATAAYQSAVFDLMAKWATPTATA